MRFVELSHPISNEMTTYPSDPNITIVREKEIHLDRTLLHRFTMGTHTGTHLDAPAHIISGGKTLDDFPLSSFTGKTVKVDLNSISELDKITDASFLQQQFMWNMSYDDAQALADLDNLLADIRQEYQQLEQIFVGSYQQCDWLAATASVLKMRFLHQLDIKVSVKLATREI